MSTIQSRQNIESDNFAMEKISSIDSCDNHAKKGFFSDDVRSSHIYLDDEEILDPSAIFQNFTQSNGASSTVIIKGFIADNETSQEVENAHIFIIGNSIYVNYTIDSVYSDESGYYEIPVYEQNSVIVVRARDYFSEMESVSYDLYQNSLWFNFSLKNDKPSENSALTVELYDNDTGESIDNALVIQILMNGQGNLDYNYSYAGSDGYYHLNSCSGSAAFYVFAEYYFYYFTNLYVINENQDRTFIFHLNHIPPDNCIIYGTIKDNLTKIPIDHALVQISIYSTNSYYYFYQNNSYSDEQGDYSIRIPAGRIQTRASIDGYFEYSASSFTLGDGETREINIFLTPIPEENSIVKGYVRNNLTNDAIENAVVRMYWEDSEDHYLSKTTQTNSTGYYEFNVPAGFLTLYSYADGYFSSDHVEFTIEEDEIKTVNIMLTPQPEENSKIYGYVRNEKTNEVIDDVEVYLYWEDNQGHYSSNSTTSNSNGYYEMNVASGIIELYFWNEDYYSEFIDDIEVADNEAIEMNMYLTPHQDENSIIMGYVTDSLTNETIEDAEISVSWKDDLGHNDWNDTYSDSNGYYEIYVPAGSIRIHAEKTSYYSESIDWFVIDEHIVKQINISLYPEKDETAFVFGYVTDSLTNEPIAEAEVYLYWEDEFDHDESNWTYTGTNGYYEMKVAAGIFNLYFYADNYFTERVYDIEISDYETIQLDFSMDAEPLETVLVKGYVLDSETDEPIIDASVDLYWEDEFDHGDSNYTRTDANGSFEMHAAPGLIHFSISKNGYFYERTEDYSVEDYETIELNFLLDPKPVETVLLKGYINNSNTNEPIGDARISMHWDGGYGLYYSNSTETNDLGYYEMNVAAGFFNLFIYADHYFSEHVYDIEISDYETVTLDFLLTPEPIENSRIQGIIIDENTGEPITNVRIYLYWDNLEYYYSNYTYSDEDGFYCFNVAPGMVSLDATKEGYVDNETEDLMINEYSMYQKNMTLFKIPDETSLITGFITVENTNDPVNDAWVQVGWEDEHDHQYWNSTRTDSDGYYCLNVAPGTVNIWIDKDGYDFSSNYGIEVSDNIHLWFNVSLSMESFDLEILQPNKGIYYQDNRIIPLLFRTIILGDIHISADATYRAQMVEFYIDGKLKKTDSSYPFSYYWNDQSLFIHHHVIKVKAYDEWGNTEVTRKVVTRFF